MPKHPNVVAHRGCRPSAPENTLPALQAAIDIGVYGVEFDVELAADGPVVIHQETMGADLDAGRIVLATRDNQTRAWVEKCTVAEMQHLDAGSWMGERFSDVRVPSLVEAMALNWSAVRPFVELKDPRYWASRDPDYPRRIVAAVLDLLRNASHPLSIISFNPEIVRECSKELPAIPTCLALWFEWQGRIEELLNLADEIGASTILLADTMVLEQPLWISEIKKRAFEAAVYPVSPAHDEPEFANWTAAARIPVWKRLLELEVDLLFCDFPEELVEYLNGDRIRLSGERVR